MPGTGLAEKVKDERSEDGSSLDSENNDIMSDNQQEETQSPEDIAEQQKGQIGADQVQTHQALMDVSRRILNNRKSFLFFKLSDGSQMSELKDVLSATQSVMTQRMPSDESERRKGFGEVMTLFDRIGEKAYAYLKYIRSNRKGKSGNGSARVQMVESMQTLAAKDKQAFLTTEANLEADMGREGARKPEGTWSDMLYDVRARRVSATDKNVTIVGAGTSTILRVDEGDGKSSYIKEEEAIKETDDASAYLDDFASENSENKDFVEDMRKSAPGLAGGLKKFIAMWPAIMIPDDLPPEQRKNAAIEAHINAYLKPLAKGNAAYEAFLNEKPERWKTFAKFGDFYCKKWTEFTAATTVARMDASSVISNRNVSTSRVASRLGMDDMVAKSETVLLQNKNGSVVRANSMEGINGISMADAEVEAQKAGAVLSYTGESMKQLSMLHIFDLICGQVDRHRGNYIVDLDKSQPGKWLITGDFLARGGRRRWKTL